MATTEKAEATAGGGGQRSPNFPAISLPEALKKAQAIYDADGRTPVSAKVLLGHLGYGEKMSGASGRMVAALRQYGVLQEVGGDKYKVSDDAFHAMTLSEASPVRKAAIAVCAKKPAMFREVLAAFPDRLPSDSALRDFLISDKKFNPASVETFIRALKGTIDFSKLYDDTTSEETVPSDELKDKETEQGKPSGSSAGSGKPSAGVEREVFSLGNGVVALEWPATLDADGLQDVEAWLGVVLRKLKRLKGTKASD